MLPTTSGGSSFSVALHGGTVTLDSAVGRGTTVTCTFPLKDVRQEAAA